jgi:signal transduction histidine kinase
VCSVGPDEVIGAPCTTSPICPGSYAAAVFGAGARARRAWRPTLAVFAGGVLLTVLVSHGAARASAETRRRSVAIDALRLTSGLDAVVQSHTALLSALRSLHHVSDPLSGPEFHEFVTVGRLLEQHPGAQALEFARRRRVPDRSGIATRLEEPSGPATPAVGTDQPVIDGPGNNGWVVEFVEPVVGNEAALGIDLSAEPSRRAAIEQACVDATPRATTPVRLVQEQATSPGLVVVSPVYDGGDVPTGATDRRERCDGLMIVVYRADDVLAAVERGLRIDFEVYDTGSVDVEMGAEDAESLVFDTNGRRDAPVPLLGSESSDFTFHGRRWRIILNGSLGGRGLPLPAALAGAAGLMFTTLVSRLVFQLATSQRRALARGRVAAAGDRDRRSLERDLHDGAQQRLLSASLALARARSRVSSDPVAQELLGAASDELSRSLEELRELAQGLHPAVLSNHGLAVAAEGLAARAPVPVDLHMELDGRLPQPVEVAAYYILCEALANAAKHACATRISVQVRQTSARLTLEVADDGVGGARTVQGSGLRGLADRVESLDGRFSVTSQRGRGTCVRATIPFG